jgi:hypothetical protein
MKRTGSKRRRDDDDGFKFKYKKRTAEQVKKRANQTGGRFDVPIKAGFDMWRPKDGENVIRILPATWPDPEHYGLDVFEHRFIGADNSNYLCLNKMRGKPCPACDEAKELKDAGEDEDSKAVGVQKRVWVYVIDRDDKKPVPQIWDMSWAQDRDISQLTTNERTGNVLLIDNPDDGFDVIVNKKGKGLKTKYVFAIERESSPISDDPDEQKDILRFISENPIPDVLRFEKQEYLEKQLSGTSKHKDKDLDDDDDDDDDVPKRKRRSRDDDDDDDAPKRKRRSRDDDDDEEDETPRRRRVREDEEDDDDEPPKKRRRSRNDEDDEDETPSRRRRSRDDDDDDDDDEPAPKKKKRGRDDDDDDDDDEPAPKKKRRARDPDDDDDDD